MRTAAEGTESWALRADMQFLQRLWEAVQDKSARARTGELIYADLPLELRVLRDFVGDDMEKVRVDSRESCERLRSFAEKFVPEMLARIEHYPGDRPLFDLKSRKRWVEKYP